MLSDGQSEGGPVPWPAARPVAEPASQADLTLLLRQWRAGNQLAGRLLISRVYGDLRRLAARELARERDGSAFQATELVHEVYLRLVAARSQPNWQDRGHFFAIVSRLVRQVLVDAARARKSQKRNGDLDWDFLAAGRDSPAPRTQLEILALDRALRRLAEVNPAAAAVVERRYIAGFTVEETAADLGLARATVERKWRTARAWLSGCLGAATAVDREVAAGGDRAGE